MSSDKVNILILDDENAIKENLVLFLEHENFLVHSIGSAEEGLKLLKTGKLFDLGIIDIRLPDMNGDKFILEAYKINPEMKFIILTGSMDFKLNNDLLQIGLIEDDVLKKPVVDIVSLINRIKEVIS